MDNKRKKELIQELAEIVAELDWSIAVEEDAEMVDGLLIGTPEYIMEIVSSLPGGHILDDPVELLEFDDQLIPKKKTTLQ